MEMGEESLSPGMSRCVDVEVRDDGSEHVRYDDPGRFSYVRRGELSRYPGMRASCHWHDDFEFIRVIEGRMDYFVDGETVHIGPGEGLFINSRLLHYGYSGDGTECRFVCVLLHPLRLGMAQEVVTRYVRPLMNDERLRYVVLSPDRAGDRAILEGIDAIDRSTGTETELLIRLARFFDLVAYLHSSVARTGLESSRGTTKRESADMTVLTAMVDFIHREHARRIRLEDIARHGAVGRSKCSELFRLHLRQSPIEFLIDVRLQTASRLLRETTTPIASVARQSGFESASYFTRTFHRHIGVTPGEFRGSQGVPGPIGPHHRVVPD